MLLPLLHTQPVSRRWDTEMGRPFALRRESPCKPPPRALDPPTWVRYTSYSEAVFPTTDTDTLPARNHSPGEG